MSTKGRVRSSLGYWYSRPVGIADRVYNYRHFLAWSAPLHYAVTGDLQIARQIDQRAREVRQHGETQGFQKP